MTEKLRIGIVGATGWMAGALAVGAEYDEQGFDKNTGKGTRSTVSLVSALCDKNENALRQRQADLKLDQAERFTSSEAMLASPVVDAVIIAVPNWLHTDFAIQALEAGKHVFLEKPFAVSPEDSERLLAAARKSEKTTKIDYILLHYDEQENLRKLVQQGAFGALASTHFTYRHPIQASNSPGQAWKLSRAKSGGALPMGTCHAISMTVFQVNAEPVSVFCRSAPPRLREFDYDTQHDIMVVFDSGVVSVVQGNIDFAEKYDARHTLVGTEGQFDYSPYNPLESRVMWSSKSMNRNYAPDAGFAKDHLDSGDVWTHQCGKTIREFIKHALKGEKDPLLGLESPLVRRVEKIIWAAEKSAVLCGMPVDVR